MADATIEVYKNMKLVDQIQNELKIVDSFRKQQTEEFLSISSVYLKNLALEQSLFLKNNRVIFEKLTDEMKMEYILTHNPEDTEKFISVYENSRDRDSIKYKFNLRDELIKLKILKKSKTPEHKNVLRYEMYNLNKALENNDLSSVCKWGLSMFNLDFRNFNEAEKDVLLKVSKINNINVGYVLGLLFDAKKVNYGSWKKFWKTVSVYDFSGDEIDNTLLWVKKVCIDADYSDERIDMSLFPNLPTIYYNDLIDEYKFIKNINWNKKFEEYELDLILSANFDTYDQDLRTKTRERVEALKRRFLKTECSAIV